MENYKAKILIVDDETMLLSILERALAVDYNVKTASSGKEAIRLCEGEAFDLLVMDVNMPEVDGFQTLATVRTLPKNKETPVLFLSGRGELDSKLLAFDLGVQDYMLKPIHTKELKARIKVHLEKAARSKEPAPVIPGPWLDFHVGENRVHLKENNVFVDLTKIECGILRILMESPEQVISREQLLHGVWGNDLNVLTRTVDAHIKKIRKKLGPTAELIESIHGVGYRFTPNPKSFSQRSSPAA